MKLNHIRDIVAVAERGSLRSAARQLGITQPAITRSIRELEQELGAALFERKPTGVGLTPIGEAVVRRAISIQSELARVKGEVEQLKGNDVGSIAIGVSTAAHVALLARAIGPFQRKYPEIKLRILEGLFPVLERDLLDGAIDLYVGPLGGDDRPTDLLVEPLFENRRLIFGRLQHPLGGAKSLGELANARWVADALTLLTEPELTRLFAAYGQPPPKIMVHSQTSLSTIITAANSDLLAILPQQWLPVLEHTGFVAHIPVRETLAAPTICMVKRSHLPLTPVAEHLADLFRRAAIAHARTLSGARLLTA